jgi:FKBP-type peptidyl-prolyl cis-trans isomerase FkpA
MRKISSLLLLAVVAFSACKENYKKGEQGMDYKIIASGKGDLLKSGEFMEVHFSSTLTGAGRKDSLLSNTRDMGAPQMMPFDSSKMPGPYFKIFKQMRAGDSLSTKTLVDSMFKNEQNGPMPPFMKKGNFIVTNIKIVKVYKTQADAEKGAEASRADAEKFLKAKADALVKEDDKTLAAFIVKNNAKTTKTANGVYVETITTGTGAMLDSNVLVKINYTGKNLEGKMFDSNTDPAKGHVEPLLVNLTNDQSIPGGVIPGMSEGLKMMQKGTKGKLYIPSGLAYGARGAGADIAPNANLIFEIEVLEIITKEQAKAEAAMQQQKMAAQQKMQQAQQAAEQKKYTDSLEKADPKKAAEMKENIRKMQEQQQQQQGGQGAPQR